MNIDRSTIIFAVALFLALFCASINAEQDELTIESQFIAYKQNPQHTKFEGDVVLVRGDLEVRAEIVEHYRESENGEYIVARGNPVRFKHTMREKDREVRGSSSEFIYLLDIQEIELRVNVKIENEQATLHSHQVVYNLQSAELRTIPNPPGSEGGGRQKATILINDSE